MHPLGQSSFRLVERLGPPDRLPSRPTCFPCCGSPFPAELLNTRKWATTVELAAAMADYIDNFYNVERRHSYLGNISPTEFETLWTSTHSVPQLA